ncbi:hypothetical protein FB451DRAFT_1402919 [Mycena latifolia]|nr:hypothetical protein FB451DRAFT_1402919 [Mycena latifolia]
MDNETDDELTVSTESLHNPEFMPALWYAQMRSSQLGLDPEEALKEARYLEEIGNAEVGVVKIMLEYSWTSKEDPVPATEHEVWADGDNIKIAYRDQAMVITMSRSYLQDPTFDVSAWFDNAARNWWTRDPDAESEDNSAFGSLASGSSFESVRASMLPSLQSVSSSSDDGSCMSMSKLQRSVSVSSASSSGDSTGPLSLQSVSSSEASDDSSDGDSSDEGTMLFGSREETLADRLKLWGQASRDCEPHAVEPRSRRLGDVLGNTVAALLDFFQPYPGDEQVPWSDDQRDAVRFRVLSPGGGLLAIEDVFFNEVMRATALGFEYNEVLPIHNFPIEEVLAEAVQQYFRDISRENPEFEQVSITQVLCEPEELEGPDTFVVSIPLGNTEMLEYILEGDLLNPDLDSRLFDLLEPAVEGEFVLHCGAAQIPADGVKGISRTASMPHVMNRVIARPLVIVVRIKGEPVRALMDSRSLGGLISSSVVDQLRLERQELEDPITLQLADITEEHGFFVANLSGYDMILGTAWLFQHKEWPLLAYLLARQD